MQYVLIETNDIPDIRNVSSLCYTTQHVIIVECEYFFSIPKRGKDCLIFQSSQKIFILNATKLSVTQYYTMAMQGQ